MDPVISNNGGSRAAKTQESGQVGQDVQVMRERKLPHLRKLPSQAGKELVQNPTDNDGDDTNEDEEPKRKKPKKDKKATKKDGRKGAKAGTKSKNSQQKAKTGKRANTGGNAKHFVVTQTMPKNTPVRPTNTRCIDDGTHDRAPAKVGIRDDKKLTMTFQLEVEKKARVWVREGSATYTYRAAVVWTDKASVQKLNSWRSGNFNRQIGKKNEPRYMWLESEREKLIDILEQHLATTAIGGAWSSIDWNAIADQYNNSMSGVVQAAGERTAARNYGPNDGRGRSNSTSQKIAKPRNAPHRTAMALRNQITLFINDRARKLVADAKKVDEEAGTDVEEKGNGDEELDSDEEYDKHMKEALERSRQDQKQTRGGGEKSNNELDADKDHDKGMKKGCAGENSIDSDEEFEKNMAEASALKRLGGLGANRKRKNHAE